MDWIELGQKSYVSKFLQSACEASGSVQTLVLIILNYLSFSKKSLRSFSFSFFCG